MFISGFLFMRYFCYNRCSWKSVKFNKINNCFVHFTSRNSFWNNAHFLWSFTMASGGWKRLYLKINNNDCFATQNKKKIQVQSRWINWSNFILFLRSLLSGSNSSNICRSHTLTFRVKKFTTILFSIKPFELVYYFLRFEFFSSD